MAANPDFKDLFSELYAAHAEFLVVGAHAVMFYTAPRYTKDLDVWVRPTAGNAARVHRALTAFGAPMSDLTSDDLARPGTIFQIGVAPNRVDILTSIEGRLRNRVGPSDDVFVRGCSHCHPRCQRARHQQARGGPAPGLARSREANEASLTHLP